MTTTLEMLPLGALRQRCAPSGAVAAVVAAMSVAMLVTDCSNVVHLHHIQKRGVGDNQPIDATVNWTISMWHRAFVGETHLIGGTSGKLGDFAGLER